MQVARGRLGRLLLLALCALPFPVEAEAIRVVASFSILGDMTRRVAGDLAEVRTLVGPDGDAHVYQPTPADARAVAEARLVIVNGLGFEGWIDRLVRSSGYRGEIVIASAGVAPLTLEEGHDHDGGAAPRLRGVLKPIATDDPHAWQNLEWGQLYVRNIVAGLSQADPANASTYRSRADAYLRELAELDEWVRRRLAETAKERRRVITSHDAFQYFGRAYDVEFLAPQGVSTESEPSAADVARLVRQIRALGIKALFVENMADSRLVEQIARETGATVGGALYADALSAPSGPAPSYVAMFRHNVSLLAAAMAKN